MKNLLIRTLTGIFFVAILIAALLAKGTLSFAIVFAIIAGCIVHEFCSIINLREDVKVNSFICSVSGAYLFGAMFAFCSNATGAGIFIPYLLSILYLMICELYSSHQHSLNNWAYTMLSQMYVALPFSTLNVLAFSSDTVSGAISYTPFLPLAVFIFLWSSDSGAYCFGTLFGKRRLFPSVSPKKSWEGSIGGTLVAIAASQLLAAYLPELTRWEWLGFALTVVVFGTWGDLVESLMKRQLGIKDSGRILPGHGGFLDRFDSSLFAIPASVIYMYTLQLL